MWNITETKMSDVTPVLEHAEEENAVLVAIECFEYHKALELLRKGVNVNVCTSEMRETVLHLLFPVRPDRNKNSDYNVGMCLLCLREAINRGADVNSQTTLGETPLMLASRMGHFPAVRFLLDRGADANVLDGEKRSAVFHMGQSSWPGETVARKMLKVLLEHATPHLDISLSMAIHFDTAWKLDLFHEAGWDLLLDEKGQSQFVHAASSGFTHCVDKIIQLYTRNDQLKHRLLSSKLRMVQISERSTTFGSPLCFVCLHGMLGAVCSLLELGADSDGGGFAPPFLAIFTQLYTQSCTCQAGSSQRSLNSISAYYSIMKKLLLSGADVDIYGEVNWTEYGVSSWTRGRHPILAWAIHYDIKAAVRSLWLMGASARPVYNSDVFRREELLICSGKPMQEILSDTIFSARSLIEAARITIWKHVKSPKLSNIDCLSVPSKMKDYLKFPDLDDCLKCH